MDTQQDRARGAALTADAWDDAEKAVGAVLDAADGGLYLTTDGEVPPNTPADSLHDVMDALEG